MDPEAHKGFRKYAGDAISTLSWDAGAGTHIPFRASTGHKHHTWAKTHFSSPELFLRPQSEKEIRLIVNLARQCGKRIVVVGSGHSPNDLTCTSSWMVNLDGFSSVVFENCRELQLEVEAGIRLYQLADELEKRGWAMPNLGSITAQSIAGAIATNTHGSSLMHGTLSQAVVGLTIMLSSGESLRCSATENEDLYHAALVSLGGLGIITHIVFQAVPAFNLAWKQEVVKTPRILDDWKADLWTKSEFIRVWWFPYSGRSIVWSADRTEEPLCERPHSWYGGGLGRFSYEFALYFSTWLPWLTPIVERYVFSMQYRWEEGPTGSAVQKSQEALTMDCLFPQFVNEWAIPLENGPEAIQRLQTWLDGDKGNKSGIPFSPKGVYAHAPIEVRVADTTLQSEKPWLDQSCQTGPTLYLNATLYRPFLKNPPEWERYYNAFEWLMKDLDGRPHWAKNFVSTSKEEFWGMYPKMKDWVELRDAVDPHGMFANDWLKKNLLKEEDDTEITRIKEPIKET
ncbi:L-gulonolactone/D-arabinono-1,4-lactone oxidase [Tuber magnatum]|uniref:D-arabinono-1,4-lactone oxidase n=1 Tax=Tuber magnatum TaxID=42249 RepID=A0A317T266_9PEZI|nr:L-gulonolactone/D-arabinono-1,4-lactone oxidase [Tuber magnatum]